MEPVSHSKMAGFTWGAKPGVALVDFCSEPGERLMHFNYFYLIFWRGRDISDIRYYPVSGQESGIQSVGLGILYPMQKRYTILSWILYLVESFIQYYSVHYQLHYQTLLPPIFMVLIFLVGQMHPKSILLPVPSCWLSRRSTMSSVGFSWWPRCSEVSASNIRPLGLRCLGPPNLELSSAWHQTTAWQFIAFQTETESASVSAVLSASVDPYLMKDLISFLYYYYYYYYYY